MDIRRTLVMGLLGFRITLSAPPDTVSDRIDGAILERAQSPHSEWTTVDARKGVPTCLWDHSAGFGIRHYYRVRFYREVGGVRIAGAPSSVVTGLEMDWTSGAEITSRGVYYRTPGDSTVLLVVNVPAGSWVSAWTFREGIGESIYWRSEFETRNPPAAEMDRERIDLSDLSAWSDRLGRDLSLFAAFGEQYYRRSIFVYRKAGGNER